MYALGSHWDRPYRMSAKDTFLPAFLVCFYPHVAYPFPLADVASRGAIVSELRESYRFGASYVNG